MRQPKEEKRQNFTKSPKNKKEKPNNSGSPLVNPTQENHNNFKTNTRESNINNPSSQNKKENTDNNKELISQGKRQPVIRKSY